MTPTTPDRPSAEAIAAFREVLAHYRDHGPVGHAAGRFIRQHGAALLAVLDAARPAEAGDLWGALNWWRQRIAHVGREAGDLLRTLLNEIEPEIRALQALAAAKGGEDRCDRGRTRFHPRENPMTDPQADAEIREGDVFRFSYSTDYLAKLFEPHHCFDGQLVAVKDGEKIVLMDSYWLYQFQPSGNVGKWFTESSAKERGELTFVCNLADVEKIDKSRAEYFDDADVFDLSYQHRCCAYYAVRKGAARSKEKMLRVINEKLRAERRTIDSATYNIERLAREAQKIEEGRLEEVYL